MKRWLILAILILSIPVLAQSLTVHFIDVGQGDSILLQTHEHNILVDAGPRNNRALGYLQSLDLQHLDLVIATHAHEDHIGGLIDILPAFSIGEVWYNGQTHTTLTFERFLSAISASGARYHEPSRGDWVTFGDLYIQVLHPLGPLVHAQTDLNNGSIALRVLYDQFSLFLTGDAERPAETEILTSGLAVNSIVLKLGHHGSRSSSSPEFVIAVSPQIAVYQAETGNPYGHPHQEVVARILAMGIDLYGTDTHGTIIIESDGSTYRLITQNQTPPRAPPRVDLNSASLENLQKIIHIGPARAKAIIDGRPWASLEDLIRLPGIGAERLQEIINEGLAYVE